MEIKFEIDGDELGMLKFLAWANRKDINEYARNIVLSFLRKQLKGLVIGEIKNKNWADLDDSIKSVAREVIRNADQLSNSNR